MSAESLRAQATRWVVTAAAVLCAVVSVCVIPGMLGKQHTAAFFDADHADELSVIATVTGVFGATSGKFQDTRAAVTWNGGAGSDTIDLSDHDNVRGEVPTDGRMPVVIWHGRVVSYEFADSWHDTDANPDRALNELRTAVAAFALLAAALGRIAGHWWLSRRINHEHFLVGELLLLPCAVATIIVAATGHTIALAYLAPVTLGVLAISLLVLPAIPWMGDPSAPRAPEPPEPERAPHPDYDMSNRPIGQRLW